MTSTDIEGRQQGGENPESSQVAEDPPCAEAKVDEQAGKATQPHRPERALRHLIRLGQAGGGSEGDDEGDQAGGMAADGIQPGHQLLGEVLQGDGQRVGVVAGDRG